MTLIAETIDLSEHLGAILTGIGGLFTTAVTGYLMLRKGRNDVRKQSIELNTEEAKSREALRRDNESWAVKEARDAYRELKKQMGDIWENERQCQIRLATYIARDRERTARIRELEDRLGIHHPADDKQEHTNGLDEWANTILDTESKRTQQQQPQSKKDEGSDT
jgi:hypothetical protein